MWSFREGGMDRPSHTKSHPAGSLSSGQAWRAAVLGQLSSLRPHCGGWGVWMFDGLCGVSACGWHKLMFVFLCDFWLDDPVYTQLYTGSAQADTQAKWGYISAATHVNSSLAFCSHLSRVTTIKQITNSEEEQQTYVIGNNNFLNFFPFIFQAQLNHSGLSYLKTSFVCNDLY